MPSNLSRRTCKVHLRHKLNRIPYMKALNYGVQNVKTMKNIQNKEEFIWYISIKQQLIMVIVLLNRKKILFLRHLLEL
ncbi:hypothetical protein POVWA2_072400 [Plasmodium ovale wallikeri]|uniref:Uncharacterized protein n=1 Tax=Plasmodium ovale wallikeri TaxID=864142 RepID=A0A1A9AGY2_PLAOA|nr:hypothetical protein POVWA1_070110 [Plasmodium ovale wallikeri]SBT56249.1 hypothetical protein POVWA2_072400 [Plasmodium ovale wallikeri]